MESAGVYIHMHTASFPQSDRSIIQGVDNYSMFISPDACGVMVLSALYDVIASCFEFSGQVARRPLWGGV